MKKFGFAVAMALLLAGNALAAAAPRPDLPEVSMAVRHDVSPPLASQPVIRPEAKPNREIPNKIPLDLAARHHATPPAMDPLLKESEAFGVRTPSPLLTFEGQSDDDNAAILGGRIVPPDTNGDVGLTHYVQTINLLMSVYNKATGVRTFGPVGVNSLWAGFGGICETNNDGDPTVLYDDAADRWVISQFAIGVDGHQCVAVSTSNNPAGSYYRYDFVVSPGTFNDYPKMGVWPDGYYISANEFDGSFTGAIAVVFERSRMLNGLSAQMVKFGPLACGTTCFFSLQPAHYEGGTAPPPGAPNTFSMSFDDETWGPGTGSDGYRLWDFSVNWASPGSSTFNALPQVNAPEFDANLCNFSRGCIRQPSPGERLDPLAQFTMYRTQYRNFGTHETLIVTHTTDVDGRDRAGVRWAELRDNGGGWVLHQTGTISPNTDSRWLSSAAMDGDGNIAVGYSVSSRTTAPAIRYVTRNAADPLGTMGAEVTMQAGGGVQRSSSNRWGDYSSMSVDPSDDCTFWYTQEYYANNGSFDFKTRIGSFKVPGCN